MAARMINMWNTRFPKYRVRNYPFGPGLKLIYTLAAIGMGLVVWRWIVGLGPSSNLNDGRGWGLWIAFDMMAGIALAGGAFTLAAVVYIFNLKRFYHIARPSILTGFIGYILGAFTLLVDLGQPQRIWHLLIYWNVHSPLFEIGWCVMLYLTVLALEFSPAVFEWLGWKVPLKIIRAIMIPLIVAGITLSTLHQSTLGTMLTIMPDRIHPLWHSYLLPLLFYISAIGCGTAMLIFESFHSARTYGYPFKLGLWKQISKALPWILGLYIVIRMADIIISGKISYVFEGGAPTTAFLIEMIIGFVVPAVMFAIPRIRGSIHGLAWAAFFAVVGVAMNRINHSVSFLKGSFYLPNWTELMISVGLTCFGIVLYDLAVRFLPMYPEVPPKTAEA